MSVLLLVLVAGGVLAGSVVTDRPEWAWLAVLLCAAGVMLLGVERFRRRRKASSTTAESSATGEEQQPGRHDGTRLSDTTGPPETEPDRAGEPAQPPTEPPTVDVHAAAGHDPGEERADVADSIVVSELDVEVFVVDEHPRYHLTRCGWLARREVLPLPLVEARQLGFTPCARCRPDATLAARQRVAS
ncbi:hypothetical protein [Parasphingorhabdus pacifica]